jgi:FHS family Na+ dependent glucose MFS transporter 1
MSSSFKKITIALGTQPMQATIGYYAAFIILGLAAAFTGPLLPRLAAQTNSGLDQISAIFITRSIGYLIGAIISGRLFDRLPGNPIFAGALLIVALMLSGVPLVSELWLVIALLTLLGVAEGAIDVGGNTLILWVHDAKAGPYINALHFFFGIGALFAPIVIAQIILRTGDIAWVFWLFALFALPISLWLFRTASPIIRREKTEDTTSGKINYLLVGGIMVIFFLYVGAELGYGNWLFSYATKSGMTGEAEAAYLTSAFWGVFTLGRLVSIPIAARFKPHAIILADLGGCIISAGMILVFRDSVPVLWIGTMLLGLSMASVFPTLIMYAESRMRLTSKITSLFLVGTGVGSMFLPWLIGQFFVSLGPSMTMVLMFVDLVITFIVFVGLNALFSAKKTESQS